jgi:hypothetical protein
LAGAAAHLVALDAQLRGERRQRAPELDHVAVAVLPVVGTGSSRISESVAKTDPISVVQSE